MEKTNLLQFIKIGSACLFDSSGNINIGLLSKKANEIENNKNKNVLVISGSIALGMKKEKDERRKEDLSSVELQGYASLGQIYLVDLYTSLFKKNTCQILVEKESAQSKAIRELLLENLKKDRISLINYNDSIDFEGIRKDNDTLAAELMLYSRGDRLIILGNDYDGFKDSNGHLIERVYEINQELYGHCNGKSKYGNGGFQTKLDAAKRIIDAGKELIISNINYNLEDIINGKAKRTIFKKR
jgi:glutamate 5-kinase